MILSQDPLIAQIDSQLTPETLDQLLSINSWEPSLGWQHTTNASDTVKQRTSQSWFDFTDSLRSLRQQMLSRINSELGRFHPIEHAEFLQLTRYQQNQQYEPHYDNFNLPGYENTVKIDRCATALLYLNDGFRGGETEFPLLGITVAPRQGDILYFEYHRPLDHYLLHAGLPVLRGEKRLVSLWIRSGPWTVQD